MEHDNRVGHCEGYYDDDFKFHSRPSSMSNPIRNIRELCPHCLNWKTGLGFCKSCDLDGVGNSKIMNDNISKLLKCFDGQILDEDGKCRHAHTVSNLSGSTCKDCGHREDVRDTSEICVHNETVGDIDEWTCSKCGYHYDRTCAKMLKEIDDDIANIVRVPSKLVKAPSKERDYDGLREVLGRIVKRLYNVK